MRSRTCLQSVDWLELIKIIMYFNQCQSYVHFPWSHFLVHFPYWKIRLSAWPTKSANENNDYSKPCFSLFLIDTCEVKDISSHILRAKCKHLFSKVHESESTPESRVKTRINCVSLPISRDDLLGLLGRCSLEEWRDICSTRLRPH